MNILDTTLYNLRPRPTSTIANGPTHWASTTTSTGPPTPGGSQPWNPRMWRIIDYEMSLRECSIYCYSPEEDPYDGEEGAIWSFNYFFFNKARKRVCYIYLRGLSIISHSPIQRTPLIVTRSADGEWSRDTDSGASKRAVYWLGDRATDDVTSGWDEDEDDDVAFTWDEDDDKASPGLYPSVGPHELSTIDPLMSPFSRRSRSKSSIRGVSEEIADSIDV